MWWIFDDVWWIWVDVCVCVFFSYPINTFFVSVGEPFNSFVTVGHASPLYSSAAGGMDLPHTIPRDYMEK